MSPPSNAGLTPEIDALRQEFERIAQQADQLVAPLSDAQFSWQPSPERWSIAHCLDHLNATARVYLPALDEAIANASKRAMFGRGPYTYNILGRLMVALQGSNGMGLDREGRIVYCSHGGRSIVRVEKDVLHALLLVDVQFVRFDRLAESVCQQRFWVIDFHAFQQNL